MRLFGVLNVTPDSFSDGGRYLDAERAIEHGRALAAEGADVVDVGGESTRPGAEAVGADEEARRVVPAVEALAGGSVAVSIDSSKAEVAHAAIEAGASIVNDVTALGDPQMAALVAESGVELVLMHMLGTPRTMQDDPRYDDVVDDVRSFLEGRIELAVAAGVDERRIWIDPGIGFGKTLEHNLELLRRLGELRALGRPILVGTSRKSFIGQISGRGPDERLAGTIASNVLALAAGAEGFRVHDVAAHRQALDVAAAIVGLRDWRTPDDRRTSEPA